MSNNNGGGALGALMLLLIFGYIIFLIVLVVGIAVYALISFYAIVLGLISIIAWKRPRSFFHLGITPYQARGIISFGIIGSILLPAFGLFCRWIFEFELASGTWFHLAMGGYAFGVYGFAKEQEFDSRQVEYYFEQERLLLAPPQPKAALPPPPKRFEYADWNDPQIWEQK